MPEVKHPAKFSDSILEACYEYLKISPPRLMLDQFAGTGKVHDLSDRLGIFSVGVELEPEWATLHPRTLVGNALHLPFDDCSFDCVFTSPTYANRMADHHVARDSSRRMTYRHTLGRALHPENSGQLQWGPRYTVFHSNAWLEAHRVLEPGGRALINCSNHIRGGAEQEVTEWHLEWFLGLGYTLENWIKVDTPRMGFGQNSALRVEYESILCMRKR